MELLSGVDLSSVMKREGALSPEAAVRLIVQGARGVAAAHAKGVVHRDIKPANLFLQQDKSSSEITVKVCDFGVAKRVSVMGISAEGRQSLTRSGGMVGSPMYMSPEQARNAKAVDERTDIWSLAVVLWEALSGQRFWAGQRALGELIIAICTDPIQRLEDAAPWVPLGLCQAVHRALERDPKNRTQTVRAFIEDIEVFSGRTDRVVMSQLVGLTESQRSELTLKASLSQAAAQRAASPSQPSKPPQIELEIAATSTIGGDKKPRAKERSGSGSAMLAVALLSAALAGGSAYYFARHSGAPEPAAPVTITNVLARVQIEPSDATVITPEGNVPVLAGEVVLRGRAGETLRVTLQRGPASKTFSVSLGSDGLASPARLSLGN
jgi:serine/threonine-protein kinase